jgi:hypothetical protein
MNSLSLYHPTKSKLWKLLNLHNKYQKDGACILEHSTNFNLALNRHYPYDLFVSLWGLGLQQCTTHMSSTTNTSRVGHLRWPLTNAADTKHLTLTTETAYATHTREEALVQDLLCQWQKGSHGFIPHEKGEETICIGCEDVNSLSLYHPTKSKLWKLLNLHDKYQMDRQASWRTVPMKAINEDGVDVQGYFALSMMDYYEWECGYIEKISMIHVNF